MNSRRDFLKGAATSGVAAAALSVFPPSIRKALAIPAATGTGTIQDIQHVVILMQENRSFDHYFGTLKGVRGFGDRLPLPLASGKPVWFESDGTKEIPPYHRDSTTTNALVGSGTPHSYSDMQAAWNQGKMGFWPKYKTAYTMGYMERADIPFQFALAEAFTICDSYHCSITTGTDPNRIVFWSGSNADPTLRAQGINVTVTNSEPNNSRCWPSPSQWVAGQPQPQATYKYVNTDFTWDTLPDLLTKANVSWHIYQDMNNNWTGAMNGCLAFASFRHAQPGDVNYVHGLTGGPDYIAQFKNDVQNNALPQVSWILPSAATSEHPGGGGSPTGGAYFISEILDALTSNPDLWSRTALFITFDENDGFFDHLPAPAVPSYDINGTLMGKATLPLAGEYFDTTGFAMNAADTISGHLRPWGMGPRVPTYVISPWSKGGWVNSQAFDHSSMGLFLEKRFGIRVDAISPWNRAVAGDLTSCFDFVSPNDPTFPKLPDMSNWAASDAAQRKLPAPVAPATPTPLFQEVGVRYSRALPYELQVTSNADLASGTVKLLFANTGRSAAVFHVYDKLHLDRIPRRYTVEAGKTLDDDWAAQAENGGKYDLWVLGPNGFHRAFKGDLTELRAKQAPAPEVRVTYDPANSGLRIEASNGGDGQLTLKVQSNKLYGGLTTEKSSTLAGDEQNAGSGNQWNLQLHGRSTQSLYWRLDSTGGWYDFVVTCDAAPSFQRRIAGRMETGRPSISDPGFGRADSF
jgi:phospholipase C